MLEGRRGRLRQAYMRRVKGFDGQGGIGFSLLVGGDRQGEPDGEMRTVTGPDPTYMRSLRETAAP
jgi:hypothetical protein